LRSFLRGNLGFTRLGEMQSLKEMVVANISGVVKQKGFKHTTSRLLGTTQKQGFLSPTELLIVKNIIN